MIKRKKNKIDKPKIRWKKSYKKKTKEKANTS